MRKFVRISTTAIATILTLTGSIALTGCGSDDGIGKRFPVSGTVKYKGQPLKTGSINFIPDDPQTARPASGTLDDEGNYSLTTQNPGDGAMGGSYKVSVTAYEMDKTKTASPPRGGSADQVVVAKARGKSLIPIKYSGTQTSNLSATVSPQKTSFDFELTD
ncbi:hypothetical protein [Singulisphaera sp. PoT]|uniref:hypothetical protein n=1 Tax=Singulisphaera sp. PoT TaxID=3411797 RepID=UPI003BF5AB53